ncbi:uncharacterized protein EI90DRAFT_2986909 [Cantharellus anzutake]|uniref:uncharacterized protein n=1 Tax=Cantharellus anzutake TaxID=1750568 RepID=UPI0019042C74|nr:uncharacterized protein EI90DRAFT_2986909 [Cantharellus anzutake]KAF8305800.1 hypothetical protein EI90DRAFT_2986909 [Cantharellus anzutake]
MLPPFLHILTFFLAFQTANSWPDGLCAILEYSRAEYVTVEERYYGPYIKLSQYCFGDGFDFYVTPRFPTPDDVRDGTETSTIFLAVLDPHKNPVLFAEVKHESWARAAASRHRADRHMRTRFFALLYDCPMPRLWGLSFLGTSVRIYVGDKVTHKITPPPPPVSPPYDLYVPPPDLLGEEWKTDVLSEQGFRKMKDVVNDIISHTQHGH